MSDLYDPADTRGTSGHAEFLAAQNEYHGPPVPPNTGVSVGEWADFQDPEPLASHEAVCPRCWLVKPAALEECGNCHNEADRFALQAANFGGVR